jgi:hypothetical protein
MEGRCERHQFDRAIDRCGRCGLEFCQTCVVYPFGQRKAPYCLPCAVEAAGVRSGAGSGQALSRRARKQLEKERANPASAPAASGPDDSFDTNWMDEVSAGGH